MAKKNIHVGSGFDDVLAEDGQLENATAVAIKRVITWQFEQAMKLSGISKTTMAERMHTSRAALGRLLDENVLASPWTRSAVALKHLATASKWSWSRPELSHQHRAACRISLDRPANPAAQSILPQTTFAVLTKLSSISPATSGSGIQQRVC